MEGGNLLPVLEQSRALSSSSVIESVFGNWNSMPIMRNLHLRNASRFKLALTTAVQLATGDLTFDPAQPADDPFFNLAGR